MTNAYFNPSGAPATSSSGLSALIRAEFVNLAAAFDKLPVLSGNGLKLLRVNVATSQIEAIGTIDAIPVGSITPSTGAFTTLSSSGLATLSSLTVSGVLTVAAINGTTVGAITAATGRFTTLTSTGAATLDSVTITAAMVANGNVTLGDALADTITIGGGSSKSATGNWVFAAPSSGTTLTVNGVAGATPLTINGGNDASAFLRFEGATVARGFVGGASGIVSGGAAADFAVRAENQFVIATGGSTARATWSATGNAVFNAPNSGTTLTLNNTGSTNALVIATSGGADGRAVASFSNTVSSTKEYTIGIDTQGGTTKSFDIRDITRGAVPFSIGTSGNVSIAAPSSGTTLTLTGLDGQYSFRLVSSGTGDRLRIVQFASGSGVTLDVADSGETTTARPLTLGASNGTVNLRGTSVVVGAAGNVTIAAPSSGTALTVNAVAGSAAALFQAAAASTATAVWNLAGSAYQFSLNLTTGNAFTIRDAIRSTDVVTISSTGALTLATPSVSTPTLTINGFPGAATTALVVETAATSFTLSSRLGNTDNTNAASHARSLILSGGASGGDPYTEYQVSGVTSWTQGIDNSDTDSFIIAASNTLGTTNRLRITTGGTVDVVAGSGNLLMNGGITRFKSAAQAVRTTSGTTEVAHGGPRVPDFVRAVLQCKTAEGGYAVGDEVEIVTINSTDEATVMANATNVGYVQGRAAATAIVHKTTGAAFQVTTANWDLFLYAHWL